jgi:hypothetical protein
MVIVRPEGLCDSIENRTRDLPACSAVPQPTAPPRDPTSNVGLINTYASVLVICSKNGVCIGTLFS